MGQNTLSETELHSPSSKNSYVDTINPNVTVHGNRAFKQVIKVK
jgi:hypothetical protein